MVEEKKRKEGEEEQKEERKKRRKGLVVISLLSVQRSNYRIFEISICTLKM